MKIYQFEIWKTRPPQFTNDHWFVVISSPERCTNPHQLFVNGLACFTVRGSPLKSDVVLNSADGFSASTACQCDYFYSLEKAKLHSGQGPVSWERQQAIKAKVREVFRF